MSGKPPKVPRDDVAGYQRIGELTVPKNVAIIEKVGKNTAFIQKSPQDSVNLVQYQGRWYMGEKEDSSQSQIAYNKEQNRNAFREVLAGEWLRLMNPLQPKIRLRMEQYGLKVLSKKLEGFVSLSDLIDPKLTATHPEYAGLFAQIKSGEIPGLAFAAVSALSTLNADLHLNNIGIVKNGRRKYEVVAIDTGMCYCPLLVPIRFKDKVGMDISVDDLDSFPFIKDEDFLNKNHMDNFLGGLTGAYCYLNDFMEYKFSHPIWGEGGFSKKPVFLEEKYMAILFQILPSDLFVENFMLKYAAPYNAKRIDVDDLKGEARQCAEIHNQRKGNIASQALKLPGFLEYIKTPKAELVCEYFIENVVDFCTKGKNHLWSSEVEKIAIINALRKRFKELRETPVFRPSLKTAEERVKQDAEDTLFKDLLKYKKEHDKLLGGSAGFVPQKNSSIKRS